MQEVKKVGFIDKFNGSLVESRKSVAGSIVFEAGINMMVNFTNGHNSGQCGPGTRCDILHQINDDMYRNIAPERQVESAKTIIQQALSSSLRSPKFVPNFT